MSRQATTRPRRIERDLGDEDRPPAERLDQRSAEDHADHRGAGADHRPVAERLHPLARGEDPADDAANEAGPGGRPLDGAEDAEQRSASRRSTPGAEAAAMTAAPNRPHRNRSAGGPSRSPSLPTERADHPERQHGPDDDPGHGGVGGAELLGDPVDRDGQDRDRDVDREQPEQDRGQDPPRFSGTTPSVTVARLRPTRRPRYLTRGSRSQAAHPEIGHVTRSPTPSRPPDVG